MKIRVNFKTPDVLDYALESIDEEQRDELREKLSKWIEYGENVTIEFDTDAGKAKVLEA